MVRNVHTQYNIPTQKHSYQKPSCIKSNGKPCPNFLFTSKRLISLQCDEKTHKLNTFYFMNNLKVEYGS